MVIFLMQIEQMEIPIFEMILEFQRNGLLDDACKLRANILLKLCEIKYLDERSRQESEDHGESTKSATSTEYKADCSMEVGWLAQTVLESFPSVIENFKCIECSYIKTNNVAGLSVENKVYFQSESSSILLETCFNKNDGQCLSCQEEATKNCPKYGETNHTGKTDSCKNCFVKPTAKHSVSSIGNKMKQFSFFYSYFEIHFSN